MTIKSPRGVELVQGETVTLFASAARTASAGTNGTAVNLQGERVFLGFLLNVTAAATDAADTLDVYIDVSPDGGTTWINACHFPQCLGTGGAKRYWASLTTSGGNTAPTDVTSDAAVNVIRPDVFGSQIRGRYVIVDADADGTFTFSLVGYAL